MSWLSSVRKGIQSLTKRQSADNLWHKCKKCGSMVFTKEWDDNQYVCPRCDHHDRVGPTVRFEAMDVDPPFADLSDEGNVLRATTADGRRFTATGRGAGRTPTTESVWADLGELADDWR